MLRLFVYGTLKRGFWNHDRFCRGVLAVEDAVVRGRLFETSSGIPVLEVPEEDTAPSADDGDAVPVEADELPVFWACGVTPQAAIAAARIPFALLLGLVLLLTFLWTGHGLGATGASTRLAAWLGMTLAPTATAAALSVCGAFIYPLPTLYPTTLLCTISPARHAK